jgi:fumarylacetoacetase
MRLDHTHDLAAKSWVQSANASGTPFPIQNLPFAIFRRAGQGESFRGGVALGDFVVDLAALARTGLCEDLALAALQACAQPTLNEFFGMGPAAWRALRHALFAIFEGSAATSSAQAQACLIPLTEVEYGLPATIGDYTDFYTSIDHARNVMKVMRPGASLAPNFQWMPVAYHGRASSIGVSGQPVRRPHGQRLPQGALTPEFAACAKLDYELELGIFIGLGNPHGAPIPLDEAEGHVFGLCLLNDWSARDIQAWESSPLGPFLAKNFATTLSPWIVTMEALLPFRCEWRRAADEPQPLAYLDAPEVRSHGGIDIELEVWLKAASEPPASRGTRLSRTSFRHQYWTVAQMVAHHSSNGCNLQPGDLFGSGTISAPEASGRGCLLEMTQGGKQPMRLESGEERRFLQDGDEVVLRARAVRDGFVSIGFGDCAGTILSAMAAAASSFHLLSSGERAG